MFKNRFNFMTFAGIQIGIDLSWIFIAILLSWSLAAGHFPFVCPGLTPAIYWLMGVAGMLGLFVCILLHELGHALVAKHFKLPVSQITLFLFGGVAEIKKEPTSPKVEFLVAIAGPLVTLCLTLLLGFSSQVGIHSHWSLLAVALLDYLATINLLILLFNLVPAFPLDGGRILRAILWKWKKDLGWATKITTRFGSGFGLFLLFFGIFSFITGNFLGGIWLAILGLFLQRAASASQTQFHVGRELKGEKVSQFMTPNVESVSPDITVRNLLAHHVYKTHHTLYPVTQEGTLLGYVSLKEIKEVPQERWEQASVDTLLVPASSCLTVTPQTSALEALTLMQEADVPVLFVLDQGKLVGLLTSQDLFKLIFLKVALEDGKTNFPKD